MKKMKSVSIVFYDGECGLCQHSIAFLSQADKQKRFFFAPLNGLTYQEIFPRSPSPLETVVFYHRGVTFTKSEAIIEALVSLGGVKKLMIICRILPRFIRDSIYDFIAGHRKKVSCIILPNDQRFLK